MNAYEYIVRIRNYASNELRNIANSAGAASRRIRDVIGGLGQVDRRANALSGSLGKLKSSLAGVFAFAAITGFTNKVIEARAEYEKFDAVLTNTFQSKSIGQGAMALLTEFAQKTPYQLNELTGGFIKLVNRGVYPTYEELTKLGDLASSQGKSFDQLVEGILDAQSGEFERMKEFGIKASKEGDKVKLSFKGVTKEVANNEKAIRDAILAYGGMKGVAGSMEVVSRTLGGQISNLEDQWWGFLVAVGSYGGGIFGEAMGAMADALQFVQQYLPQIAHWFDILYQYLSPLVNSLFNFFKVALEGVFGLSSTSDALGLFGDVMISVLMVVNWFITGLSGLMEFIKPLAPYLLDIAIAWGLFNAVVAMSPIGWLIIGIVAIITIIGMVIKYTDGWGVSFKALGVIFDIYWDQIQQNFKLGVDTFKFGFNLMMLFAKNAAETIVGIFRNVGDAIKLAMSGDFSGAFSKITEKVKTDAQGEIQKLTSNYKETLSEYKKNTLNNAGKAKEAAGKIGISVDTAGIGKDFKKLKDSFGGLKGEQTGKSSDYLNAIPGLNGAAPKDAGKGDKDKKKKSKAGDGITGGGSKLTNITININKLQDYTVVNVNKTEEGLNGLGDKVQEILLRAVNSANQMQTN